MIAATAVGGVGWGWIGRLCVNCVRNGSDDGERRCGLISVAKYISLNYYVPGRMLCFGPAARQTAIRVLIMDAVDNEGELLSFPQSGSSSSSRGWLRFPNPDDGDQDHLQVYATPTRARADGHGMSYVLAASMRGLMGRNDVDHKGCKACQITSHGCS